VKEELLGRVIFLRHGHAKYTNIYPDLTQRGFRNGITAARQLELTIPTGHPVTIISSPKPRAQATADIIQRKLLPRHIITREPDDDTLVNMTTKNTARASDIFRPIFAQGGIEAVDRAYLSMDCFDDPEVFEPRLSIRARLFSFLNQLINRMDLEDKNRYFVCVTHFELLHWLAGLVLQDGDQTLSFCEPIVLEIYYHNGALVKIKMIFRLRLVTFYYNLLSQEITWPNTNWPYALSD